MKHSQRGSSMIEFVIGVMALTLIVFGIIEFGRALYTYHTVENAARLGSRWAMVRGTGCTVLDHCGAAPSDVQTYVQSQVVALMDPTQVSVATQWAAPSSNTNPCATPPSPAPGSAATNGANAPGQLVCVTVTYPFTFMLPIISNATLNLSSTSQMIISN